ncbi:MAG: hypothetical protein RMM17_13175 [Acidobacteriota bacterium]|nr:hypothetical protein [Blastocatellia bacterium]MDW8413619.1 hypothetical protein [Acidobacteriota bacterium]
MKLHDWIFGGIILLVVAALFYISVTGRHPQSISINTIAHQQIKASTPRSTCLECHDPVNGLAGVKIQPDHPEKWKDEKFSCLRCHKLQE